MILRASGTFELLNECGPSCLAPLLFSIDGNQISSDDFRILRYFMTFDLATPFCTSFAQVDIAINGDAARIRSQWKATGEKMEQFLSRLLGQATGEEFNGILEVSCCYFVCCMQRVVNVAITSILNPIYVDLLWFALRGDRVELAEDFGIYWRSPVPISPPNLRRLMVIFYENPDAGCQKVLRKKWFF